MHRDNTLSRYHDVRHTSPSLGLNASGLNASGLNASGLNASGLNASGLNGSAAYRAASPACPALTPPPLDGYCARSRDSPQFHRYNHDTSKTVGLRPVRTKIRKRWVLLTRCFRC